MAAQPGTKHKTMIRRVPALLLIAAGLLVALWPGMERAYTRYWQERLVAAWEEAGEQYLEDGGPAEGEGVRQENLPPALAVLEIKKIGLRLPVLQGTGTISLKMGAGLLEGSAAIGKPGNTVITAHRSHTRGHQFNRLDELKPGDLVALTAPDGVYTYRVFNSAVLKPEEVYLLDRGGRERVLTLVTCHPLRSANPPYRLVVQAELLQPPGEAASGI